MIIKTKRFGETEINESDIWNFANGLPGLEEYQNYTLLEPEESYPVAWLQSIDESEVCLPVTLTFKALPDYSFDVDETVEAELPLNEPGQLIALSVLNINEDITQMTANLAAPILVNTASRKGRQVILTGADYPVRRPIFKDLCKSLAAENTESAGVDG